MPSQSGAAEKAARLKALDEQAQAAWKAKDWVGVVELYSQAIALDPQYAKAWRWRGYARSEIEQHGAAIADARKAVELEPGNSNAHNGVCWTLIMASRVKEARQACEQALSLEPQSTPATTNLGSTYLLAGDKDQAWRWYEQSIGLIQDEAGLNEGMLEDFNIFERKGWQVALVREARAHFEPRAREYLKAQAQAQALIEPINAAEKAKDRALELALRQQRLALLSPWLAADHPRRMVIDNTITNTQEQLGDQLVRAGKHREAVPHYQAVLRAKEERLAGKPVEEQGDLIGPLNDLATAFQYSKNDPSALPLFEKALAIAEVVRGPEHPSTGTRLNNLAALYESMGQYAQAMPLYQRALAISEKAEGPEHPNTGTRLNNLAYLYQAMGQYAEALPLYQRALAISEKTKGPDHPSTGARITDIAGVYRDLNQYDIAASLYLRAISIFEASQNPSKFEITSTIRSLALVYRKMDRYDMAVSWYQRAMTLHTNKTSEMDKQIHLDLLSGLAISNGRIGNYEAATMQFTEAVEFSNKHFGPNHPRTARAIAELAGIYYMLGSYHRSLELYEKSLAIEEYLAEPKGDAGLSTRRNIALLNISIGRYQIAAKQLRALNDSSSNEDSVVSVRNLHLLALAVNAEGDYVEAIKLLEEAIKIEQSRNSVDTSTVARLLRDLAGARSNSGDRNEAERLYLSAWHISTSLGQPDLMWSVCGNLMRIYSERRDGSPSLYQPALAIWYGKQAVNTLQSVRGNLQGLDKDLQKGFLEKNQKTYQTLANLLIEAGRIPEAEQVLAMLKERELGELVRSSAAEAQKTQADLVGVEKRASAQMAELSGRGVREATELAALDKRRKELGQLGQRLSEAEEARRQALIAAAEVWRAEYQRFTSQLSELFAQSARIQERKDADNNSTRLQAKVALDGAGAVGLHYVVTDEQVAIIVATPRASFGRFSPIKRTELNRQINALRQAITNKTDTRAPAQALWNALIAPVQADIEAAGARTLVLSLTDTLRYLPFAALQNPQGRYLVEDMALSLWAQAADVNPTASTRPWQVAGLGLTQAREGFSALPAVRGELQGIVKTSQSPNGVLPGQISLDEQFNRQQLEDALSGTSNVLHIASHFDFKPGDESRSVLLLGQGEPLSLGKLAVMDFGSVEQLTLSACDTATGGGTNENGAEVEGLAATVLRAQAKAVLATLWKVADDSTARLMQDFYRQRAQDKPPSRAQALRAAQLALLHGESLAPAEASSKETGRGVKKVTPAAPSPAAVDPARPFAHPYYWAPFVLSGSWL